MTKARHRDAKEPCLYEEDADQAYEWALDAWWNERESATSICNIIGIPRWKLSQWMYGPDGWKERKAKEIKKAITKQVENDKDKIQSLMAKMFKLLDRSVTRLSDDQHVLSVSEFNSFAGSVEKLFKVRQLMLGNPTDIFAEQGASDLTWDKVLHRLKTVDILDFEQTDKMTEDKVNGSGH